MFYLWETATWNVQPWDCGKWGNVVSGEWDPQGRFIILSFGKTQQLMVVHITQVSEGGKFICLKPLPEK